MGKSEHVWKAGLRVGAGILMELGHQKQSQGHKEAAQDCRRLAIELRRLIDWPDEIHRPENGGYSAPSPYEPGLDVALDVVYERQLEVHERRERDPERFGDAATTVLVETHVEALRRLNAARRKAIASAHRHQALAPAVFVEAKFLGPA